MKSSFIIMPGNWSFCALIYRLQKKQIYESAEISENTSSVVHFLVVWGISKSTQLYADVLLVEHEGFDWDKDDLEALYRKNNSRFRLRSDSAAETWLLDDNIALIIAFEIMNEDRILNIAIFEVKRNDNTRTPAHIDLER
jgi:hypothetical protein